jgi:UDP-2-acetamido-3-amino-2,3-dideoxy-glucuronate N-acetyltransferase
MVDGGKFKPPIFIHHLADCEPGCCIGDGTKVWRWSHIMNGATIGVGCMIGACVFIASTVRIGNDCRIQNNVFLPDGVIIEDSVFIGPNTTFCNVKKPKAGKRGKFETTLIKNGAVLGAGCTILPGLTIGAGTIVGAGSVVTKSMPDNVMCWGNPAKIQRFQYFRSDMDDKTDNTEQKET